MALLCRPVAPDRTRTFWTTQPDACGTGDLCGTECGRPGLSIIRTHLDNCGICACCGVNPWQPFGPCPTPREQSPRTIANTDWVRSLALNMLLTDARKADTSCGRRPGSLNGHWSESFVEDGTKLGTALRYIDVSQGGIRDIMVKVKVALTETLQKLVSYGVAAKVDVDVTYAGRGLISAAVDILIVHSGMNSNVALSGSYVSNQWAWQ